MFPPLFSVGQVMWLCCLIVPLLAISLVGTPTDATIMQRATGKNQCAINGQVMTICNYCSILSIEIKAKLLIIEQCFCNIGRCFCPLVLWN